MRSLLLLAVAVALPARAGVPRPFTVAVTGGTLGVGPELTYDLNPIVSLRASATFLGLDAHGSTGGYRYRGHARIANAGGTIDLHPFANGFRLSAGARSTSGNRVRFAGMARDPRSFGPVTYTPEQVGELSGTVRTRGVAPIVTVGYVRSTLPGLTFGIDAGAMFHGTPRPYDFAATGQLGTNPNAQADYASQRQRVRDAIDGYRYYPVAQLSLGYRF